MYIGIIPTRWNGRRRVADAHRLGARALFTCPGDRPRPDHRKQRAGLSTSNLADHWARIGVVGVLRVRLVRWSNYLARIIKRLL